MIIAGFGDRVGNGGSIRDGTGTDGAALQALADGGAREIPRPDKASGGILRVVFRAILRFISRG
jgi:hypothetical protein